MEGVVALGFACNVVQLIDSSFKAIEIYKHIRENGTTAQVENLIQSIQKLSEHSKALQQSLNATPNNSSLLKSDIDLLELCKRCSNVVQPLEQEFAALSIGPASGRKDAIRKFFKLKRKATHIEKAKHELDACVQDLDSSILIHLSQNMGTLAGQHRQILDEFEDSQRKLASDILNGNTVVRDLLETLSDQGRAHVTQEHTLTRQHIDTQFASLAERQAYQAGFDDFLASLHYPEITLRQDTISDAHKKTFEWIFDRTSREGRSWSNFAEWAHSNEQLYWVLGKPGSGKSTLMKFLVSDPRLTSALDDGCGNDDVFVMSFFFWEAGIDLQKNRVGLFRSLIWQLFRLLDPSTALLLYADVVRPKHPRPVIWTPKQLLSLLSSLTGNIPQRIFLFLDGLDEFKDVENECDAIGDVIDLLRQQKNVKICISSRPAACLEELYSVCPNLHLQDLTKSDISRYVEDKLSEAAISRPGMRSALRERSDLRMKLEADHSFNAKEAAVYLQLVRTFGQLSLLEFAIAASPEPQNVYLKNMDTMTLDRLGMGIDLDRVELRVNALCGGFLDLHYTSDDWALEQSESFWSNIVDPDLAKDSPDTFKRLSELRRIHYQSKVSFMHRTAQEYFDSKSGRQLLQDHILSESELIARRSRYVPISVILTTTMSLEPAQLIWNLPTADTVNMFKAPKTKCMKDRLLEMEDACGKIMSLVKGKVDLVRHQWAFYEGTDRLDCAKSFLRHAPLAYVEHKLRATGMINNARYLTDMLRLIATHEDHTEYECWDDKFRFLLELGADPNAMILGPHWIAPSIDMTIWQHLLLDFHRRLGDKEGKGRLIYPWLEADADVYASTICRLCSKDGSYGDLSTAHRCPGNGFLIYEERVLCRLEWYHDIFDCLISQGDLKNLQRRPVLFLPRDGWFVLSDIDLSRLHILKDIQSLTEDQLYYDTLTIEVNYYELVIELHNSDCYSLKQQHEVFPNGYDAFRAAGWSDGDLQGLSIEPELLQRTYDTRVHSWKPDTVPEICSVDGCRMFRIR